MAYCRLEVRQIGPRTPLGVLTGFVAKVVQKIAGNANPPSPTDDAGGGEMPKYRLPMAPLRPKFPSRRFCRTGVPVRLMGFRVCGRL